ncbi:MAG: hypothetical protein IPK35_00765 [Saprospiraceae bacterium]|jgi:hypothetical protein|nr:hypothetical protein [Saprospiraceae bacterium]
MLEGIVYITDENEDKKFVQIDLEKYGDLWPDFLDIIIAHSRKNDKKVAFNDVKKLVLDSTL